MMLDFSSAQGEEVKKEAKGSKALKPMKVPAKSPVTTPSKANDDKEVNRKQFEANAMALRKAFDEDESIDLPKFEDNTSIETYIKEMVDMATLPSLTAWCKENQVPLGKNKTDRIRGLLMNNVDEE